MACTLLFSACAFRVGGENDVGCGDYFGLCTVCACGENDGGRGGDYFGLCPVCPCGENDDGRGGDYFACVLFVHVVKMMMAVLVTILPCPLRR